MDLLNTKISIEKILALIAFVLALFAAVTGNQEQTTNLNQIDSIAGRKIDFIEARHLANLIISKNNDFLIFDLRDEEKYKKYHIPHAKNFKELKLLDTVLISGSKTIIIYDQNQKRAAEKWLVLKEANLNNVFLLRGGIKAWANEVLFPDLTDQNNLDSDSIEHTKKMSLYFGGKPKFNSTGKGILSRRYNREGC